MKHAKHQLVSPITIGNDRLVADLVVDMGKTAFQARNLYTATHLWAEMLKGNKTIFLGLAGAMVPAGMKRIIAYLIENRMIDCLVSTGANLSHDCYEALGHHHWQGNSDVNDIELFNQHINRIYDVYISDEKLEKTEAFIEDFAAKLDSDRCYTTREFFYLLGKRLKQFNNDSILVAAFKAKLPIFCPAMGDSAIGLAVAKGRFKSTNTLKFDIEADILEISKIVANSDTTGVIYIGGGTPKNFIQQSAVLAQELYGREPEGHKYGIQITTDVPCWGGSSGCTFSEAQSWGKLAKKAKYVTVYIDATIALPLIATTTLYMTQENLAKRNIPKFSMGMNIDIK